MVHTFYLNVHSSKPLVFRTTFQASPSMTENLIQPFALNQTIELQNRIVMAPLTRCMADDDLVPTQLSVDD